MLKLWIHHPATQDGPVSITRWLLYHVGDWLEKVGSGLVYRALHPDRDDEIPF
jgi:hypothetical protein